jgi:hypothetical protein
LTSPKSSVESDHRREIGTVAVLILLGGGGAWFVADRVWLSLTAARAAPFAPLTVESHGRNIYGAITGLAIVTLLGAVLLLVTGRWARVALGSLLALVSIAQVSYGVRGLSTPSTNRQLDLLGGRAKVGAAAVSHVSPPVWPILLIVCGLLSLLGAALLIARCGRWNSGLSSRYEVPAAAAGSADPWRSLDRGEDPTISDR